MESEDNFQELPPREAETRANGSQIFTEPYSVEAIDRLRNIVANFYHQGDRKYYSVSVDGEVVVPKNCDGRKFTRYLPFVTKHTQMVEVKMYSGYSPNCNKYQFILNRGLSGMSHQPVNVQTEVNRALEEQQLRHEMELLREELEKKKRKLKKYKELTEEGESGLDKFRDLLKSGVELAGALGLRKVPGLAGAPENKPEAEVEVTVESDKKPESKEQPKANESESKKIYDELLAKVGEKEIKRALRIMALLSAHPELEETLTKELNKNQKTQSDGQA